MVSNEPTRTVTKRLKAAGFTATTTVGSHTKWVHPTGFQVTVPDGHRTISPGVVRQVNKVIAFAKDKEETK
jgi:predicted RNA binding protein YcfA (HicA-like mRNA interferase family)